MAEIFDKNHSYAEAFAMCDCHSEILGFFSMANEADNGYFITCYSALRTHKKAKTNEFYFSSAEKAREFAHSLMGKEAKIFVENSNNLSVTHDEGNYAIIQFLWNACEEVTWEVIFSKQTAEMFAKEILSIIDKVVAVKAGAAARKD